MTSANKTEPSEQSNVQFSPGSDENENSFGIKRRGLLYKYARNLMSFQNECHRKNFIQTCCVYFNFVLLGWTYGQLGTAFQDLQLILKTNIKQTSLVFTMNSIGYMAGSLCIGFFYDRVSHLKLLGFLSVVNGVTSIVLPWCKWFGLFLFVRLLDGFLCGGRDGGGNCKVASCWGTEGGQYIQALHFTYAFGGIISPLVTNLFLAPRIRFPQQRNTTVEGFTVEPLNATAGANQSDQSFYDAMTTGQQTDDVIIYGETHVHIAFVITGVLTSLSGFLYIVLQRKGYDGVLPYSKTYIVEDQSNLKIAPISRVTMTRTQKSVFIVCLGVCVILYSTVECKYQSFIMPFVLMQMKWTKSQGAFLISILWAFFGAGRFSGIFISRFIQPKYMLLLFLSMLVLASCILCVGTYYLVDAVLWIMIPAAGLSISIIFPTFIVWTQENALKITGKISGFFLFAGALGFFIDPLYIGYLMENVSPMYFNYLNIAEAACSLSMVILLICWIDMLREKQKHSVK